MVLSTQPAAAWTQVTLAWSPNSEPDLAGYRAFSRLEGEDYDYNDPAWEGPETTCTVDILEDSCHCFVARAVDTEGYESADSNEVCNCSDPSTNTSSRSLDAIGLNDVAPSYGCFIQFLFK